MTTTTSTHAIRLLDIESWEGEQAVVIDGVGYWVRDEGLDGYRFAPDAAGRACRVYVKAGRVRSCTCGRRRCGHLAAAAELLARW